MPMDRKRYPPNWEAIALSVKAAADWTCEECSRPCRRPGETDEGLIERIETEHPDWAGDLREWQADGDEAIEIQKLTRFTLTTAHPNHDPENPDAELKAWCSVCHCRYDLRQMGRKRRLKAEQAGQLSLESILLCKDFVHPLIELTPAGQGKDPTRIQLALREELE